MKRMKIALSLAVCLVLSSVATAAPLSGLKFEQQKQQIVKFANRVLESAENKTAVQSATRALDKNNSAAYQKAISAIACPMP
ncbi:YicS family protein [Klebsiella grimontii]|uniref:YicS family protein n=1 Tax=Klebsiella grimontii TaxID=2058152 RepID=UPI003D809526